MRHLQRQCEVSFPWESVTWHGDSWRVTRGATEYAGQHELATETGLHHVGRGGEGTYDGRGVPPLSRDLRLTGLR